MIYCLDTSAWMDGWVCDYPPDVFPSIWEKLNGYIEAGSIRSTEEVYVEIKKKEDSLHDWLKARKQVFLPLDQDVQTIVFELLAEYPRLVDTHRNRSQADPFVIATAEQLGAVVVTGEQPRGKLDKPKIPDVCEARGLRWISFLEMLRELGWQF